MANFGYLLGCEETRIGALIDPSFEPEKLVEMAKEIGLKIEWILSTHGHFDHVNGNEAAVEMTGAKIAGHSSATFHVDHKLEHGNEIKIGNIPVEVLYTPGHCPDEVCFFVDKQMLFTGDVLFYAGKLGIINAEGASLEDYRRDIQNLADLNVDTLLPGHGVFILGGGQKHIDRGIRMLNDFVLPETFFETNEFTWQQDYQSSMGSLDA